MRERPDQSVERAKTQKKGMEEIGSPLQDGAPFSPAKMDSATVTLSTAISTQKGAEKTYHSATKEVEKAQKTLDDMYSRNVKYYAGQLGPYDPRNLKVGGKVRKHPVHHKNGKKGNGEADGTNGKTGDPPKPEVQNEKK